jgi:Gpi18-like mannosyltransferase
MSKFSPNRREAGLVILILAVSLAIRLALIPSPGYVLDINTYKAWIGTAVDTGLKAFYGTVWCDYPPFNVYIFLSLGSIAKALSLFGTDWMLYLIKLPSNIIDLATAFLIFCIVRKRFDFKTSLIACAAYAFNPATIFNSAIWGQFDAIYTFLLFLSVMTAVESRPKLSGMFFALALLTKPQSIALLPLLTFFIARRYGLKKLLTSIAIGAGTVLAVILPFQWSDPIKTLVGIYTGGYGNYAYTSVNAFNLWGIEGFWLSDARAFILSLQSIGWIMFGACVIFALYALRRKSDYAMYFAAFVMLFAFFMLPTRIHERYLFPAFSFLALFLYERRASVIYVALSIAYLINQAYVLYFFYLNKPIPKGDLVALGISLVTTIIFACSLALIWKINFAPKKKRR